MTDDDVGAIAADDVGTRDLQEALRRYRVYRSYCKEHNVAQLASVIIGQGFVEAEIC